LAFIGRIRRTIVDEFEAQFGLCLFKAFDSRLKERVAGLLVDDTDGNDAFRE